MDFRSWSSFDQIALENLEIHLQHWQQFLDAYEGRWGQVSTPPALQASLRRHLALFLQTRALLDQQRLLLLHLQEHQSPESPPFSGTSNSLMGE